MPDLDLFSLLMGLFGGLAIFLFGMEQMTDALKRVAGDGLSKLLGKLTTNRFTAAISGALVTAIIQSSSVTTVLVVGFISAGLMTLQQSIGVIMGANVGTTITAQVIAFKVTEYALALIAVGFAAMFLARRQSWKQYGTMLMGLGMIFLGMGIMSDATKPLRTFEPFIELMQQMGNPVLGIAVAAVFTALVQSSSATTGIVIVLASQGFITLEAGIALAFGANIGTCVTAGLATLGKPREAKQAAVIHLLFNVLGVAIWLPFIGYLAEAVLAISPISEDLTGTARLAADAPRQIANAHTIFNVANTCIFILFVTPMAWLVKRIVPVKQHPQAEIATPRYLQADYLQTPGIALDRVRMETVRLADAAGRLSIQAGPAVTRGDDQALNVIESQAHAIRQLYDAINAYIRQLATRPLSSQESKQLASLTAVAGHIESYAEGVAVNMLAIGRERCRHNVTFSEATIDRLSKLEIAIRESFDLAVQSMHEPNLAGRVVATKPHIQQLATEVTKHLSTRLTSDDPNRVLVYRLESQLVEIAQREYYFAKKIAKEIAQSSDHPAALAQVWQ